MTTVTDRLGRWATPGYGLLPLRLFLGGTFTYAGLDKLSDPTFWEDDSPTGIVAQLTAAEETSPLGPLLDALSGQAVALGVVIAIAEVAVGLGTLFGLWTRLAALGGLLISLNLFLTVTWDTRPYYFGSDIFAIFAWTPLVLLGACGVLSLDARLARSAEADPARRSFNRLAGSAAAVAGVGVALVGAAALVGRARDDDEPADTAAAAEPEPTSSSSAAGGTAVLSADAVKPGEAVLFEDPATGQRALAVRPASGPVRAFSAVCTHQGCTVAYNNATDTFRCPCHGGIYDARTGAVVGGPPPRPLREIPVTESGGQLRV